MISNLLSVCLRRSLYVGEKRCLAWVVTGSYTETWPRVHFSKLEPTVSFLFLKVTLEDEFSVIFICFEYLLVAAIKSRRGGFGELFLEFFLCNSVAFVHPNDSCWECKWRLQRTLSLPRREEAL